MNHSIEKSLYHLLGNGNLNDVADVEIQNLSEKYPWFSVVHAIQSKKSYSNTNSNNKKQLQKTSIYFNNPLWLQYQLLKDGSFEIEDKKEFAETQLLPSLENVNKEEVEQIQEEINTKEQHQIEEVVNKETALDNIQTEPTSLSANDEIATNNLDDTLFIEENKEEIEIISVNEKPLMNDLLEAEANDTEMKGLNEEEIELPKFNYTPLTEDQLKNAELEIAVEPYHTIDYFDSQGIKVNLDEGKQDKLSHQLRRFTDWLKHMKAIGTEDALEAIKDPQLEATIQGIAEVSNASREIVTETMADVLVKQGKTDKAIQLYIKLSFLNPGKSPYFASKIQELKGISQ